MKPKLSIIVPIYNVEKYINKCIDSILAQTFTDFELILVDDGTLDNCGKICDEYAKADSRIKVIHKKNGGLSSARNAGIDIAQGEYIGFVDSDDLIKDDMYDLLYKAILKYNADISICNFIKFDEDSQFIFKKEMDEGMEVWTNIEALEKLNTDNDGKIVVAWNKLYKKELWNDIRFPKGKIHEDAFTMHKILFAANKVVNTNKYLYGYLQRNSSIIGSGFSLNSLDYIEALHNRIKFYDNNNLEYLNRHIKVVLCAYIRNYYYLLKNADIKNKKNYLKSLHTLFIDNYIILKHNRNVSTKERFLSKLFKYNPNLFVNILTLKMKVVKWVRSV